jgi:hypothetical protein
VRRSISAVVLIKYLIVAAPLFVWPSVVLNGASRDKDNAGCSRINPSRASQFISYEGVDTGTSYSDVQLRLHNNSDCPIIIETDDHEPFLLRDKKIVALHYFLHDQRRGTLKSGYGWGDSIYSLEIRSGDSVWFRVPLARLKRTLDVAVPFKFAWDDDHVAAASVGGVKHYVYFYVADIPTKDRRTKPR